MLTETVAQNNESTFSMKTGGRWVRLNVGGRTFLTTRQTINRFPDSFLSSLCEGLLPSDMDSENAYLIDRNPDYFTPVLDYLRHGKLIIRVLEEAEFYNLPGLIQLCKERIAHRDQHNSKNKFVYRALQCNDREVASLLSSMSDGWKLKQLVQLSTDSCYGPGTEYLCIVSKNYRESSPSLFSKTDDQK
ncbi:BTB/POZ domain-containing protein [Trichinella spiralis]|uniref:BTB/POZ domain-containing protein n=1 Tax=Trichinella spiralis TaxID=6334 RepID=A0ABR3KHY4_TRISP